MPAKEDRDPSGGRQPHNHETRWGVFKVTPVLGKKPRKVPVDPKTFGALDVKLAFTLPLDEALGVCGTRDDLYLGYLPDPQSDFVGLDFDACVLPDGTLKPWAETLLEGYQGPKAVTVSGTGLRLMMPREPGDAEAHNSGEKNDVGFYADGGRGFVVPLPLVNDLQDGLLVRDQGVVSRLLTRLFEGRPSKPAQVVPLGVRDNWFDRLSVQDQREALYKALKALPEEFVEERDAWLEITHALKGFALGASWDVHALWQAWSRQSNKHDPESEAIWDAGDDRVGGLTLGTVLGHAKAHGFDAEVWAGKGRLRGLDEFAEAGGLGDEGDEGVAPSAKERERDREAREIFGDAAVDTEKNLLLRSIRKSRWSDIGLAPNDPPGLDYVVPGYVPRGLVTTLYGVDGLGKNMLVQRACMLGVARGEFFGQKVAPGLRVAFFGVEDVGEGVDLRARKIGQEASFGAGDWKALDARFHMPELIDVDAKMMAWERDMKGALVGSSLGFAKAVDGFVRAWKPDLLVLDPISDLFSDEENNRARVVEFMRMLVKLARRENIGLMLIGHPARSEGSEYSGSGAWSSKSRSRLFMERDQSDPDTIWLRAPKNTYGRKVEDRECRWSLNGVLVDMPGPGAGGVVAGGSQGRQDAVRQAVCDGLEALARAGINTGLGNRAGNKTLKALRDYGALKGFSDPEVSKELKAMLGDGTLVSGFVFNGAGSSPIMRSGHSDYKTGLYFPGGSKPIFDPF